MINAFNKRFVFVLSGLTENELFDVENTQLSDVINVVTQVSADQTQRNVFLFTEQDRE